MSKRMPSSRWYLKQKTRVAVGLGFGPWYRDLLVDAATRLAEQVEVRRAGVHQPYGLIWIGDVRLGKRLPGELIETILEEFPGPYLGPLLPAGYDDADQRVFAILGREFPYAEMYAAMLGRLLEPYAESVIPDESITPIVHLGTGVRQDSSSDAMSCAYEALCPTSMAFGAYTEGGFVPLIWRSSWRVGPTYGAALR